MAFFLNIIIDTSDVDQNIACCNRGFEIGPSVRGRIALATWITASVVDGEIVLL